MEKSLLGSLTAKSGFKNEEDICDKFNNFRDDLDAREWLDLIGYNVNSISKLEAITIPVNLSKKNLNEYISKYGIIKEKFEDTIKYKKADIQIQLNIKVGQIIFRENISCKKAKPESNFNQIDKRQVEKYKTLWGFNKNVEYGLKLFTGTILPPKNLHNSRSKKRLFLDELPEPYKLEILDFFKKNKVLVISDILKGRGDLSAEWLLVTKFVGSKKTYKIKNINEVINFYSYGDVKLSPRKSLEIGRITMQRKGGTPDPTSLQFKFQPLKIFD